MPGDLLRGVEKAMGLKAGEKVKPLAVIRVVSVRPEPLSAMIDDEEYGRMECILEGFGDDPLLCQPFEFVTFFCKSHKGCVTETIINRIEFEYVDDDDRIKETISVEAVDSCENPSLA